MATVTITLPDALVKWIGTQIEDGNCAGPDDYIEKLILQDRHITRFSPFNGRKIGGHGKEAMTSEDVPGIIGMARMLALLRSPSNEEPS